MMHTNRTLNRLKIIQLNVNSIVSITKRHELEVFLNEQHPSIVMLNETKIKPFHKVQFKNFTFIRNDRIGNGGGGGTGILIRENIIHSIINIPNSIRSLECTIIKVPIGDTFLYIISVYHTYGCSGISLDTHDLDKIINNLNIRPCDNIIMGGDFNAKHVLWFNTLSQSNINGKRLYDWYIENTISHDLRLESSLYPTRIGTQTESFLDIFFVSSNIHVTYSTNMGSYLETIDFDSDHRAVVLNVKLGSDLQLRSPKTIPNYSNVDWGRLNTMLEERLDVLTLPDNRNLNSIEIDFFTEGFIKATNDVMECIIPKTTLKYTTQVPLTGDILRLIAKKKNLRRKLYRIRHTQNNETLTLRNSINDLSIIIQQAIATHKRNTITKKIESIRVGRNTFKQIKHVTGYKAKTDMPPLSDIANPNIKIHNLKDKSDLFGRYFQQVYQDSSNTGDQIFTENVEQIVRSRYNTHYEGYYQFSNNFKSNNSNNNVARNHVNNYEFPELPPVEYNSFGFTHNLPSQASIQNAFGLNLINLRVLKSIIKSRGNKRSCGPDLIPNIVIRKFSDKNLGYLVSLFNHSFNTAYYPKLWKLAKIIPINKPRKPPDNVESYRPIALLSSVSKIYERFIYEKIKDYCDENFIIPIDQFGFREGYSTIHALTKLLEDITICLNDGTPVTACSLDNEKAFDKTWTAGLIFKMRYIFGFSDHICRIIYQYLTERHFFVGIDDTHSNTYNISSGVPQGSVLAAILYVIYLSDLPPPPPTPFNQIRKIQFADDIMIYMGSKNNDHVQHHMNKYLKILNEYLKLWKGKLNAEKCATIVFKGKYYTVTRSVQNRFANMQLKINNSVVENRLVIKYLGLELSHRLNFIGHIDNILKKASITLSDLKKVLSFGNSMDVCVKLLCYKQLIRPIITYGFATWSHITSHQMERLRTFERKCLRLCTNLNREENSYYRISNRRLYETACIEKIDLYLINMAIKFLDSTLNNNNPIISGCGRFDSSYSLNTENKFKPPHSLLHQRNAGILFDQNERLIYYHRPASSTRILANPLVYVSN